MRQQKAATASRMDQCPLSQGSMYIFEKCVSQSSWQQLAPCQTPSERTVLPTALTLDLSSPLCGSEQAQLDLMCLCSSIELLAWCSGRRWRRGKP